MQSPCVARVAGELHVSDHEGNINVGSIDITVTSTVGLSMPLTSRFSSVDNYVGGSAVALEVGVVPSGAFRQSPINLAGVASSITP